MEVIANSKRNESTLNTFVRVYALDSVIAAAFGVDLRSHENPNSAFIENVSDIFKQSLSLYLFVLAPSLLTNCPFAHFPAKKLAEFFGDYVKYILAEKRLGFRSHTVLCYAASINPYT